MVAHWIRHNYMGRPLMDWNIEELCGYKPISTYYTDFGIAEWFGKDAIRETYDNAMANWGSDIKWVTEIYMVLNWKIWEHYETESGNEEFGELYHELWEKTEEYVFANFGKDDILYFLRVTD